MLFHKNNWATGLAWPAERYKGCDQYREQLSEAKQDVVAMFRAGTNNIARLINNYDEEDRAQMEPILEDLRTLFGITDPHSEEGRRRLNVVKGMGER